MPDQNPDAEAALRKLGQRIREGNAIKHPTSDEDVKPILDAVREEYEQEQKAEREKKSTPDTSKGQKPKPPEQDMER